ncbi:MAG TPA: S1 RNA-binding domain-containing protein [Acidimicrobiales bacterium]|nr:S1 RNA-binding domain-containing protein [Acidimicrobiales bacterium]
MQIEHVIIDGSNIATEGRDAPSLAQLDEAVQAFIEEYSPAYVTVVVDATFPNRIDPKERATYEDAVNANELITPPAGAIGRGDAFVLQIARRAGASILSNDSFQEFHGDHPWLFDRGRLFGGKPVPHVGWVFMERAPVRGPTSRRAVSEARKATKAAEKVAKEAAALADAEAADETGAAPDGAAPAKRSRRSRATKAKAAAEPRAGADAHAEAKAEAKAKAPAKVASPADDGQGAGGGRAPRGVEPYNEALPFIEFVGAHAVGSEVEAVVERFSSHGAYVTIGPARAYVPLRNLADPAPRSAKDLLRPGETRRFVVVAVDPPRRGIDLALPGVIVVPAAPVPDMDAVAAEVDTTVAAVPGEAPAGKARSRKKAAAPAVADEPPAKKATRSRKKAAESVVAEPAKKATRSRKKAAEPVVEEPAKKATRSRKKAAEPVAGEPAKKATRSRKKAAAKAAEAVTTDLPPVVVDEPAPPAKRATRARRTAASNGEAADADAPPAKKATRSRKKAAAVADVADPG